MAGGMPMTEHIPYRCKACRESIRADARICHHCGTSQKGRFWGGLGEVLKWLGGFAAVLSLVAGAIQLNSLHDDWQKKQRAVVNYLAAAKHQFRSGDYENAQLLLQEAFRFNPASSEVRDFQIDFLMKELRMYYFTSRQNDNCHALNITQDDTGYPDYDWGYRKERDKIREYLKAIRARELMALGVATSTGKRKADILAHMAWMDLLIHGPRNSTEIDELFDEALQSDPANPYGRIMLCAWLSWHYNNKLDLEEKLTEVLSHFAVVRQGDEAVRLWVKSMQYEILSRLDDLPQAEIEMLRLAAKYRDEPLFKSVAADLLGNLDSYAPEYDEKGRQKENPKHLLLHNAFSDDELLELTAWLGERAFGCAPGPECSPKIKDYTKSRFYNTMGFLYERKGQHKKALGAYRMYQGEYLTSYRSVEDPLAASLKRVMARNKIPATTVRVAVRDPYRGPVRVGDLIYRYDGHENISRDVIIEINRNHPEGADHTIDLLRNGEHHAMKIEGTSLMDLNNYKDVIVPAELVSSKTAPERIKQLYKDWVWLPGSED